jgi:hypothetical protein
MASNRRKWVTECKVAFGLQLGSGGFLVLKLDIVQALRSQFAINY